MINVNFQKDKSIKKLHKIICPECNNEIYTDEEFKDSKCEECNEKMIDANQ